MSEVFSGLMFEEEAFDTTNCVLPDKKHFAFLSTRKFRTK
jgi:hypothetical protein